MVLPFWYRLTQVVLEKRLLVVVVIVVVVVVVVVVVEAVVVDAVITHYKFITSMHINRFLYFLAEMLGKHGNAKTAPSKCCDNGLPKFSQLLLDFFNTADFQLTPIMPYDSINLVLHSLEFISGLLGPQLWKK